MKLYWQKIELTEKLKTLIIFSDGFVDYNETSPEKISGLAERIINDYETLPNLGIMLAEKRKKDHGNSYIAHDEASAIALEFKD